MMARWAEARSSVRKTVLFWWILFVVMQTAERLFLLRDAFAQETPTLSLLLHTLAQNPILFASEALRVAWVSRGSMAQRANTEIMPYDVAVRTAQGLLGPGEVFPNPRYPLVRAMMANADGIRFTKPANVIILFLEGLDRPISGADLRRGARNSVSGSLKGRQRLFHQFLLQWRSDFLGTLRHSLQHVPAAWGQRNENALCPRLSLPAIAFAAPKLQYGNGDRAASGSQPTANFFLSKWLAAVAGRG